MTKKERIEALEAEVQALKDEVAEIKSRYLLSSIPATQPKFDIGQYFGSEPDLVTTTRFNPFASTCSTCGRRGLHTCWGSTGTNLLASTEATA